jgi:hypothetical protein
VLQPAVAAYQGGVKLEQLRKDPNIVLYFSNILQKPATWIAWIENSQGFSTWLC